MCVKRIYKLPGVFILSGLLFSAAVPCTSGADSAQRRIPILNPADLEGWKPEIFKNKTHYEIATIDGQTVLEAQSHDAASGLVRRIRVDLTKTPYLHWRWRIDNVLHNVDEKTKRGDDYPARIYVIVSGGWFFWQTRALNYVWSSDQPVGSTWPNAFTGNAVMLAVRSGDSQLRQWHSESRNVLQDLSTYLHKSFTHIDAVAIMTDTDNSGQNATAYYGEIYFSDR
jgi:hypothetical protein